MAYGYYGPHDFFLSGIISLLWWIVIIVLIVSVVRLLIMGRGMHGHWHDHPHPSDRALEILKERYAKGEIDKAEFEEKKKVLSE
ncbi:MAG: SHOCT domain-containing protein [Patescibacteria group bacterium]|nr:SHOCT domain-containing protein [Patescibacteria group bacterium]